MRIVVLALLTGGFLLIAQSELPPVFLIGRLAAVTAERIVVQDSRGTHLFFCDAASTVWRGQERNDCSALRVNDEVIGRYRLDSSSRAVVIKLWANIDKVEGRITSVGRSEFQVDEKYSAPPDSAHRRGIREIVYDSGTTWESSEAQDLKVSRDVFVIGLKLPSGVLEATRVIIYERGAPVRMKTSRIVSPNGVVH
jgi:hypothetical protein